MKSLVLVAILLAVVSCDSWAVLVAGSNTWANYRHQADVYHAYQVLIKGGFDASKIITLAYDDIAHHVTNPFKGKVFNKPTYKEPGVDVYAGVKIDYTKLEVTPEMFEAVLSGNKTAVKGKGTERVLESTSSDNVFVFFSDHGAAGLIAFPHKYLYADHLNQIFTKMSGKYKKVVFYLESCESGSMFVKLPKDTGIYGLSAANPTESSWGTYCAPDDVVGGKHIGSCLGDLFSVNFVQDTEKGNYDSETLLEQFNIIKKTTAKSEVLQWGDLSFQSDKIAQYFTGSKKTASLNIQLYRPIQRVGQKTTKQSVMDSRTMKLQSLSAIYSRDHSKETFQEMVQEMQSMQTLDRTFSGVSKNLELNGNYNAEKINFECLRTTIDSYESKCGKFSDYGLSFIKYFAQGCESLSAGAILEQVHC